MEAGTPSASSPAPCPSLWLGAPANGSLYLLLPLAIPAGGSLVLTPAQGTNPAWILSLPAENKHKAENPPGNGVELHGASSTNSKWGGKKKIPQQICPKNQPAQCQEEPSNPSGSQCGLTKSYECSDCGKSYRRNTDLIRHQRNHTGERPYLCVDCGKSFSRSSILLEHQRIHTGEKPYKCSYCGQGFSQSSNRNQHERTHGKGKAVNSAAHWGQNRQRTEAQRVIPKILKRTTGSSGPVLGSEGGSQPFGENLAWSSKVVIKHQRSHLVEKPYRCPQCGKCFARSTDFIRHHIIHTGEKPYTCVKCGKSFTRNSVLIEHQRIHTGERPYKCRLCGKGFSQNSNRNQHETIHQAPKPVRNFLKSNATLNWNMGLTRQQRIHSTVGKA